MTAILISVSPGAAPRSAALDETTARGFAAARMSVCQGLETDDVCGVSTFQGAVEMKRGFMQGMRHEMGRGMMRDALIESFRAIRTQLGGG
jgi:hypothetical protein